MKIKLDFIKPLRTNRRKRINTFLVDIFWFCLLSVVIVALLYVMAGQIPQ